MKRKQRSALSILREVVGWLLSKPGELERRANLAPHGMLVDFLLNVWKQLFIGFSVKCEGYENGHKPESACCSIVSASLDRRLPSTAMR